MGKNRIMEVFLNHPCIVPRWSTVLPKIRFRNIDLVRRGYYNSRVKINRYRTIRYIRGLQRHSFVRYTKFRQKNLHWPTSVAQAMGRHCEAVKFTTFCYSERGIFGIFWQTFCGMYVSYEEDPYRDNFGSIRLEMMESELDY